MKNPAREKFLPLLSPYVDGELSPEERKQVEQHLANNKESASQVADFRAGDALMRHALEMQADQVDWKDFSDEVMSKLTPEKLPLFERVKITFSEMFLYQRGPLVAGLVGAFMVGKRIGYGKEAMAPHSLTLTMVGASLLWVGWFGFNAGSALEANGFAALAFINTLVATAAAVLAWCIGEALMRGKASMLGAASGAVAGLVAITPAAGNVGIGGALVIGLVGGFACLWGVNGLKKLLGADDSLDVFGVHGIGGIVGALLTGVFNAQILGGPGLAEPGMIGHQLWVQLEGVLLTIVWSGVVAWIAYKIANALCGMRVPEDQEREGLDVTSHGESAYHS